jgi:hypothetical protein
MGGEMLGGACNPVAAADARQETIAFLDRYLRV